MSVLFDGTYYLTLGRAARAWAYHAAPDGSVFSPSDSPASEARALRIFWDSQAVQSEGMADLPEENGETVDEDEWIEAREYALEKLIRDYIGGTS